MSDYFERHCGFQCQYRKPLKYFGNPVDVTLWAEVISDECPTEFSNETRVWSIIPKRLINTANLIDVQINNQNIKVAKIGIQLFYLLHFHRNYSR